MQLAVWFFILLNAKEALKMKNYGSIIKTTLLMLTISFCINANLDINFYIN